MSQTPSLRADSQACGSHGAAPAGGPEARPHVLATSRSAGCPRRGLATESEQDDYNNYNIRAPVDRSASNTSSRGPCGRIATSIGFPRWVPDSTIQPLSLDGACSGGEPGPAAGPNVSLERIVICRSSYGVRLLHPSGQAGVYMSTGHSGHGVGARAAPESGLLRWTLHGPRPPRRPSRRRGPP